MESFENERPRDFLELLSNKSGGKKIEEEAPTEEKNNKDFSIDKGDNL